MAPEMTPKSMGWRGRKRDGPKNDPRAIKMERKEGRRPQKRAQGHKDGEKGGETASK